MPCAQQFGKASLNMLTISVVVGLERSTCMVTVIDRLGWWQTEGTSAEDRTGNVCEQHLTQPPLCTHMPMSAEHFAATQAAP